MADGEVKIHIDDKEVKEGVSNLKDYQEAFDDFDTSDFTVEIDGVQKSVKKLVEEINKGSGFEGFEKSLQEGKDILENFAQAGAADIEQLKKLSSAVNNAQSSLKQVKPALDDASKGAKNVANENKNAKNSFNDLKNPIESIKNGLRNLFSAYLGIQGVKAVISYCLQAAEAFRVQERAVLSLNTTLKNAGVYTAAYSQQIQQLASEIQSYSNYSDEVIIKAQALGQAYAGQIPITERATKAVVDFAAATGMDLEQAFSLFGKSVGSSTNALARYGIQLQKGMTDSQKMEAIVKQLGNRYQGQARQMADATIQLKNTIGDLSENIGEILNPTLMRSAKFWRDWTQEIINARTQLKLLQTENQQLGTLSNAVDKQIALRGELYKLEKQYKIGGTTRQYYNQRKAEIEQEIKFLDSWRTVYAKRQIQEEQAAKLSKGTKYTDDYDISGTSIGKSAEKIKAIQEQIGAYQQLTNKVSDLTTKLRDLAAEHKIGSADWVTYRNQLKDAQVELDNVNKSLEENGIKVEDVSKSISSSISSGLISALRTGGNAFDVFSNLATTALQKILDKMLEMAVITPVLNALTGGSGGTLFSNVVKFFTSANGNVFENGKIKPFAKGGIVDKPTIFPMANGAGLMGEAGAEAVMPLRRMSNGRLGVEADSSNNQVVNIYNYSNSQVETRKRDDNTMDVFIKRVNEALSSERTSSGFKSAYLREDRKGVQAV